MLPVRLVSFMLWRFVASPCGLQQPALKLPVRLVCCDASSLLPAACSNRRSSYLSGWLAPCCDASSLLPPACSNRCSNFLNSMTGQWYNNADSSCRSERTLITNEVQVDKKLKNISTVTRLTTNAKNCEQHRLRIAMSKFRCGKRRNYQLW